MRCKCINYFHGTEDDNGDDIHEYYSFLEESKTKKHAFHLERKIE